MIFTHWRVKFRGRSLIFRHPSLKISLQWVIFSLRSMIFRESSVKITLRSLNFTLPWVIFREGGGGGGRRPGRCVAQSVGAPSL